MRTVVSCSLVAAVFTFIPATAGDVREDFTWLTPRGFQMRAPAGEPEAFFTTYREAFELADDDELVVIRSGRGATKLEQRHAGVLVIGGEYVLATNADGKVIAGNGSLGTKLPPARPVLATDDAIAYARAAVERRLKDVDVKSSSAMLVYAPTDASFEAHVLAYRVRLILRSARTVTVDVDATTGVTLQVSEGIASWAPIDASGWHLYDGLVEFRAEEENGMCRLNGGEVITYDTHETNVIESATVVESSCAFDDPAVSRFVSAHYGVDMALRYFDEAHGRFGFDGAGGTLPVYVDLDDNNPDNAFYAWEERLIGVAPPSGLLAQVALDVMAHETAHAVIATSMVSSVGVGLYDHGESGALGEGIADIFGTLVEFAYSTNPNWWINDDVAIERYLDTPSNLGHPDTYGAGAWEDPTDTDDHGHIHSNATVAGHWFYLLANGGAGTNGLGQAYSVTNVGRELAGKLVYEMITGGTSGVPFLTYTSSFANAANASSLAAKQLCGEASQLHVSALAAWNAVGVPTPPGTTFAIEPGIGALIDPWPAKLRWQVAPGETSWVVQLSPSPLFDLDVKELHLVTLETVGGVAWANAQADLAPSTMYFWRVRAETAQATECWRPLSYFTTDARKVKQVSPLRETDVHPWELALVWEGLGGPLGGLGLDYEVEVHLSQACAGTPMIAETTTDTSLVVDLYVQKGHAWRVRARKSGFTGAWSACLPFTTSMPKTQILAPTSGQQINPWGFEFHWEPVKGVRGYLVESTRDRGGIAPGADIWSTELGVVDRFAYDLAPALTYQQQEQWWRVTPLGPLPLDEKGGHGDASYFNHGDGTIPPSLAPHESGDPPWFTVGDDVKFRWKTVKHATAYEVSIYPLKRELQGAQYFVQWSDPQVRVEVPAESSDEQTFIGSPADFAAPDETLAGYLYSVRAIGPNGKSPIDPIESPGQLHANPSVAHPGDGLYLMRPAPIHATGTHLLVGASGKVMWNGGISDRYLLLDASQTYAWSPTGDYYYQLHHGVGCNDAFAGEIGGNQVKTYEFGAYGEVGSYRVRAIGDYPTYDLNVPNGGWSNCYNFTIASKAEQNPEPAPEPSFSCTTEVAWGENITDPQIHSFYIEMGTNQGETTLEYDLFTNQDAITVWHDGDVLIGEVPCGSGTGSIPISWAGGQEWIEVRIQSNCAGTADTDWNFTVYCP